MIWATLGRDRGAVDRQKPRAFGLPWRLSARNPSAAARRSSPVRAMSARGDDPPEPPAVLARGDDPPEPPAVPGAGAGGRDLCCRMMRRSQSADTMAAGMY